MDNQIVESEQESSAESSPECYEVVSSQESQDSFEESYVPPYDFKGPKRAEGDQCMAFTGPVTVIKEIFPKDPFTDKPVLGVKVVEDYLIVATGHVDDDVQHDCAYGP